MLKASDLPCDPTNPEWRKMTPDVIDISEAILRPQTLEQYIQALRRRGEQVVKKKGLWWRRLKPFFFDALHPLKWTPLSEIRRPSLFCLGYRCLLPLEQDVHANGKLPVHLLVNEQLKNFNEGDLRKEKRKQLRKAQQTAKFMQILDPDVHLDRIYEIAVSTLQRIGKKSPPDREKFRIGLRTRVLEDQDCLVAAFIEGELAAYKLITAVENVAYFVQTMVDSRFLRTEVGVGLYFESIQLVKRSNSICYLMSGHHAPENTSLTKFKEEMGLKYFGWPSRYWLSPLLRWYLALRAPAKLYRITGSWPTGVSYQGHPEESK